VSALVDGWLQHAVWLADAGRADELPARSSMEPRPGPGEDWRWLRWSQSAEEAAEWADALHSVGSSVRAVVLACVDAYLEVDGHRRFMTWPCRLTLSAAA
jgi:hypothetical protein